MHVFILSALCLCLTAGSLAQQPQPCRSPPFMQGRILVMVPKDDYYSMEEFFYDGSGQRVCRRARESDHSQTIHREEIFLFREGVYYEISHRNQTCRRTALKAPWIPLEVPKDASFLHQVIIGSLSDVGEGLLVNNWAGKLPEFKASYFMTFTQYGCLPVSRTMNTEDYGVVFEDFYDLVVGIEDPDVFIPPSFCGEE